LVVFYDNLGIGIIVMDKTSSPTKISMLRLVVPEARGVEEEVISR